MYGVDRIGSSSFSSNGWLRLFLLLAIGLFPAVAKTAQSESEPKAKIVTIPLSIVAVDEATATISVLEEPLSSFSSFLKNCQSSLPEDLEMEGKDFSEDVKKFCELTERYARRYLPPPTQYLEPKGYVISVPLKSSFQAIEALLWTTKSLDDAISFVSLLQGGNLKAVKVYSTIPWGIDPGAPCKECPIKELVFSASGIKEQLEKLKKDKRKEE